MGSTLSLLAVVLSTAPAAADPPVIARPDAFQTLVNPQCSHCRDEAKRRASQLRSDDRVLCWVRGYSDGGAVPLRFFLAPYRVISDTYGVFVYDPEAGYARGFAPSLDFRFHGWRNGVVVLRHKDGTLFSGLTGLAFDGPRKGERLRPVPTLVSDWGWWVRRYPQNVAYHMFDKYRPIELPTRPSDDSLKSRGPADPRLASDEPVFGVFDGTAARAYPLQAVAKAGLVRERDVVVLWQGSTRTAAAYRPVAEPAKKGDGEPRPVTLSRDDGDANAPFVDRETGSRWDVAGRAVAGELKGRTLGWLDGTQVKWFAWAADYPKTTVYSAPPPVPAKDAHPARDKAKEVGGTAEFLRAVPKHFARLDDVDASRGRVTLLVEGEKLPKVWPLTPDAEVKVSGWWGRAEQLRPGDRVWVWFKLNRRGQPVAVLMLADEPSEQDIHGNIPTVESLGTDSLTVTAAGRPARKLATAGTTFYRGGSPGFAPASVREFPPGGKLFVQSAGGTARVVYDEAAFEAARSEQRTRLAKRWEDEGLPGTMTVLHPLSGEAEFLLDHEAMRWGRSLRQGDEVSLRADPPIRAVVKNVTPWRERTQLRLVVHGQDQADLAPGQRITLRMTPPTAGSAADLPPDLERPRSRAERVEWFLASVYCTCGVPGDTCTGHFYTLASCNVNGCGAPAALRKRVAARIDAGKTDRQILDELLKENGPTLLRPHLAP